MHPDDYIRSHKTDFIGLCRSLVSIPSVNPPGDAYGRMTRLLSNELKSCGLDVRVLKVPKSDLERHLPSEQRPFPRWNIVGRRKVVGARKTLHFNAHYDVVPVSGKWIHKSPFSGAEAGGWQYGRGTADMKGSIASLLMALRSLKATRSAPAMNLEVSFTADEETGSALGAAWLVKNAPIRADYAVVMEGGDGDRICCGHNGIVWLEVRVWGRAAHGSTPDEGVNAFEKMAQLTTSLDHYRSSMAQRVFIAPDGRALRATLNVGGTFSQIIGGKINTVPAGASFTLDRRVLPSENASKVEGELRDFLRKTAASIPDCRIDIDKIHAIEPCLVNPQQPFFECLSSITSQIRRRPAHFCTSTGFNDMHFFARQLGVPTAGYGPLGKNYHAVDEKVSVSSMRECAQIYARLMTDFHG